MSARRDELRDDLSKEEIVRQAARRGYDPARVAAALGVELDPKRLELVADEPDTERRVAR